MSNSDSRATSLLGAGVLLSFLHLHKSVSISLLSCLTTFMKYGKSSVFAISKAVIDFLRLLAILWPVLSSRPIFRLWLILLRGTGCFTFHLSLGCWSRLGSFDFSIAVSGSAFTLLFGISIFLVFFDFNFGINYFLFEAILGVFFLF